MVGAADIVNYLRHGAICIDTLGEIVVDSDSIVVSNNSVIARCSIQGIEGDKLLKCYYRPFVAQQILYNSIYIKSSLAIPTLTGTISKIDVLIANWKDGAPLADVILDKGCNFKVLSDAFDALAYDIISRSYLHSDITPDNIIVDGNKLQLIDIDDAKYSQFEYLATDGCCTAQFSHRHRDLASNENIDHYPLAALSTILAALATYQGRRPAPQQLVEFGCDNLSKAIIMAQQRLLDKSDMVHYQIGIETTNLLGKIPNLSRLLAVSAGPINVPSVLKMRGCTPNDVQHRIKSLSVDIVVGGTARQMLLFDDML